MAHATKRLGVPWLDQGNVGALENARRGGRGVAERQHDSIGFDVASVIQRERPSLALLAAANNGRAQTLDLRPAPGLRAAKYVLDIDAVLHALRETGSDIAAGASSAEPVHEMVGLVGKGAEIGCAHVEEMRRVLGAVGQTRTDPGALLDQDDVRRGAATARQMRREHGAAEAAADNGNAPARHRSLSRVGVIRPFSPTTRAKATAPNLWMRYAPTPHLITVIDMQPFGCILVGSGLQNG